MNHGPHFDYANTHYRQDVATLKKRAKERKARKKLNAAAPDLLAAYLPITEQTSKVVCKDSNGRFVVRLTKVQVKIIEAAIDAATD